MDPISRRRLFALAGRAGAFALVSRAAGVVAPASARAAALARPAAGPGAGAAPELIERNAWPEHYETTLAALGQALDTPNRAFFVRSHFPVPVVDTAAWRLEVTGLVARPLTLTAAELDSMPRTERRVTLECAGNGRALMPLASTSGTQWRTGAVGTAAWSGVALAALLERAGVKPEAKHVWLETADHATLPQAPPFLRSVPLALAQERGLVARRMNGAPLPRLHGGPARLVLPGWYGVSSPKWLVRIRLAAAPSDNHFMIRGYRYVAPGGDPLTSPPVDVVRVKSVLTRPLDAAAVHAGGPLAVEGFAWTGAGDGLVRAVELTFDDGATWTPAALDGAADPFAWRRFRASLVVPRPAEGARTVTLAARATDSTGDAQPKAVAPNVGGYGNHAWHRVTLRVLAALAVAAALAASVLAGAPRAAWAGSRAATEAEARPRLLHPYAATLPRGAGQAIATHACLVCHSAQLVNQQAKDSTAWEKTIAQMEKWGAPVAPTQHAALRDYLVRALGPRKRP